IKYPSACKDSLGRLRVGAALGVTPDVLDRAAALVEAKVDVIAVDTAHGHTSRVIETVEAIKKRFPELEVIAGNVGTQEGAGELILRQGRSFKSYRGMGSIGAMKEGSRDRYFQEFDGHTDTGKLVPEGIEGMVPYKGPLSAMVQQLVGGLRAGMGYCGTGSIRELQTRSRFVRISSAGLKESHVH